MTKAKSELEQMGEDTEYMVKSTAELQGLIKGITGFDILEADQKTLKSTYDIVLNIGKVWGSLSDLDRNSLLYALAGTRQSNALAAALTNIEDMQAAYEAAENSAGSARKEQEKYTRSIQYSLDVLKATGEELSSNLFDSQGMKNTVDMATKLLEIINSLTKSVGGLGTAFTALMAYKGFKNVGIFSALSGTGKSIFGSARDFFTQKQLSDTAITAGITQNDIQVLTRYDQALKLGITDTTALQAALHGASPEAETMAVNIKNGTVRLDQLTTATKATAIGVKLLNAAMNMLIAYGIALLISKIHELINAQKEALQTAREEYEASQEKVKTLQDQQAEITELIQKYKELKESEQGTSAESREKLLELQEQITNMVANEANNYNLVIDNLDLVNGKLEDQLDILNKISNVNLSNQVDEAESSLAAANKQAEKFAYHQGNAVFGSGKSNIVEFDFSNMIGGLGEGTTNTQKGNEIINRVFENLGIGSAGFNQDSFDAYYELQFAENTSWQQRLDAINQAIDALKSSSEYDTSENAELYEELKKARDQIQEVVLAQTKGAQDFVKVYSQQVANNKDLSTVDSYKDYMAQRQQIIREISRQDSVQDALFNGLINQSDIENAVDNYLSTLSGVSTYYEAWLKNTTQGTQSDYEKAKSMLSLEEITRDFSYSDYKDQINEVTKTLSSLSSVYEKLGENKVSDSDLMSLFDEFPELSAYAGDMDELQRQVKALATQKAEPLLTSLRNLAKTVKDPEQKEQLEGLVHTLEKMAGLSSGIEETAKAVSKITASDYIKYEEDKIQDIIDKLEEEKSTQDEILESLKSQKEELEEIVSEYEKTADVVGKYIDRTQIKPLENQKSEIEEYYNAEIEKLKEENEERSRNIELQEKQNALANARKTKMRVYTETQGYVWKNDESAIIKAEKELSDLQNSMAIEDLEKQRDSEVKSIEEQIKAWENYKDQWKEQVEAITEADEELIASKVLGADWHEKVADQDISVMENYGAEYASYNNQLKNQVSVEITNLEKVIKERDTEIDDWKDYKNELSKLNTDITDSNKEYLDSLNQFVLDENSTWQDRIDHMKRNVEIIRALNAKSEGASVTSAESDIYAVVQDGEVKDWYYTQQDAENAKRKIAENMAKSKVGGNVPQGVLESIIQGFMTRIRVQKYAKGGANTTTGFAWLDGSRNQSEVVFNSAQAKELYEMARGQNFANEVKSNIMDSFKNYLGKLRQTAMNTTNAINISFDGANINAESYESFKDYMDRYTNDLFMKIQTGR